MANVGVKSSFVLVGTVRFVFPTGIREDFYGYLILDIFLLFEGTFHHPHKVERNPKTKLTPQRKKGIWTRPSWCRKIWRKLKDIQFPAKSTIRFCVVYVWLIGILTMVDYNPQKKGSLSSLIYPEPPRDTSMLGLQPFNSFCFEETLQSSSDDSVDHAAAGDF